MQPLLDVISCAYWNTQSCFNPSPRIIIWRRIWKMNLRWCWICNSKMWSMVNAFCLDFYNKCFLWRNLSLGLATKARACKGAGQEGSSGVTSHASGSVRECEGINPHTPKGAPTLGVGVQVDFRIFKKQFQGSKPTGFKSYLCHWEFLRT
jgi:hypothetical protein